MRNTPHSVDNSPAQLRYNARRLSAPNIQDSTRLSPLVTGKVTPIQQQVRFLTTHSISYISFARTVNTIIPFRN